MRSDRHATALALILALATPGLGGAWLQLADPCPEMTPWAISSQGHGSGDPSGQHQGHQEDTPGHHTGCTCIESCQAASHVSLSGEPSGDFTQCVLVAVRASVATTGIDVPLQEPLDRLPPANPPPQD